LFRARPPGKYFPITTFRRLIAHTRLTFILFQSGRRTRVAVGGRRRRAGRQRHHETPDEETDVRRFSETVCVFRVDERRARFTVGRSCLIGIVHRVCSIRVSITFNSRGTGHVRFFDPPFPLPTARLLVSILLDSLPPKRSGGALHLNTATVSTFPGVAGARRD
jgi:hypothetical protein